MLYDASSGLEFSPPLFLQQRFWSRPSLNASKLCVQGVLRSGYASLLTVEGAKAKQARLSAVSTLLE